MPGKRTYQDIYPSEPIAASGEIAPRTSKLLSIEYFEAPAATMPTERFDQHHILINLKPEPHRVENWRDGEHRDFTFHHSEIVVTPAGVESGWRWHETSRVIVATIFPEELERFAERELGVLLRREQLADIPVYKDEELTRVAEQYHAVLTAPGPGSDIMVDSLARIFLVRLVGTYGEQRAANLDFPPSFSASQYKRVLDYLADNIAEPITIEDIAAEAGLSTSHFTRLFKKVVGSSPYQFLMRYRAERAAKLLGDRNIPLAEIAHRCGYADQAHFTRQFKRWQGKTPRQYRADA